jgi:hypothetical protein
MSKTVTLRETKATYAVTLDEAQLCQAPFAIERDGEPVAAVVPFAEYREFIAWRERMRPQSGKQDDALAALEKERAVFLRLKEQLLRSHQGKFVAILNGEVIDADEDDHVLTRRVYAKHGYVPVYVDRVIEQPPVRQILSPKKVAS